MFTQLASIIGANESLNLHLTLMSDGRLKLVVMPKAEKGANPALAMPLCLTALPAELDAEFAATVLEFVTQRASLKEQAAITATIIAAAKSAESTKGTRALQGKSTKPAALPAPVSSVSDDNGGDGDSDGDTPDDEQAPAVSAPAPAAPATSAESNDDLLSFFN